jgi:hypothetical protein
MNNDAYLSAFSVSGYTCQSLKSPEQILHFKQRLIALWRRSNTFSWSMRMLGVRTEL